jgi:hypothetical protein
MPRYFFSFSLAGIPIVVKLDFTMHACNRIYIRFCTVCFSFSFLSVSQIKQSQKDVNYTLR